MSQAAFARALEPDTGRHPRRRRPADEAIARPEAMRTDLALLTAARHQYGVSRLARALDVKPNTPHMMMTRLRQGGRLSLHLRRRLEALVDGAPRLELAPLAPLVERVRVAVCEVERALADLEALDKKFRAGSARGRRTES